MSAMVASGGILEIKSGGVANNTTVKPCGSMCISSGGVANITTVNSYGYMFISSGGEANSTTVNSGGDMRILSGGVANSTTVNYGYMYISSGGVATEIIENGGYVEFAEGADVTFVSNTISGLTLNGRRMTVHSNTVADSTTVNSLGFMHISSGGVANITTVNCYGFMYISSGGVANITTVNSHGSMYISSGGVANSTTVNSSGRMYISSGGVANITTVNSYGYMFISSGGEANSTTVNSGGDMRILSGGVANSTTVNYGYMYISSGGVANSTTVNAGGYMYISGGMANNTTVNSGGRMSIDGVHRGSLQIKSGAVVSAYVHGNGVIDFTVSERTTADTYLINDLSLISGTPTYTITVSANQALGTYKLAQGASSFTGTVSIGDGTVDYGMITVNGDDLVYNDVTYSLDQVDGNLTLTITESAVKPELTGNADGIAWSNIPGENFVAEYSTNSFANSLQIETESNAVDTFGLPAGTYQWRVKGDGEFVNGEKIVSDNSVTPQNFVSDADGDMDLFFANANGTWEAGYAAKHQGFRNGWTGTKEQVLLVGKNKITDVFSGSDDANILVLTDGANGDALFVEDIYTSFGKDAARISQIDEIRAGVGDDIIDMTSQKFAYAGGGIKIYGGQGNDTIWANNGNNTLFGDAGNDRIVGGSDDDFIIGGIGNDSLHGGGGDDIFCFGNNWGNDTVEQFAGGIVTLWFKSGSESNWNASTLTYTDGANSVKVSGIAAEDITLKFGETNSAIDGAFADAASEKIFEDKNKGMLA